VTLVTASLLGLATSVAYWLTFNPTAAYARWVERRYRAEPA
jgi:predicted membrane chloride channel (bestrophin family)